MNAKWVLFVVIFCILLFGILYYYGFVYSFRNFAGSDSPRPIKEYHFNQTKPVTEQSMNRIDIDNPRILLQEDTSDYLKGYGWFPLSICSPADTSHYFIKLSDDLLQWNQENSSAIRLFNITSKDYYISSENFKESDKKVIKNLLYNFEYLFISPSHRLNNADINE